MCVCVAEDNLRASHVLSAYFTTDKEHICPPQPHNSHAHLNQKPTTSWSPSLASFQKGLGLGNVEHIWVTVLRTFKVKAVE